MTGLTAASTYAMKVRARDAAGNWSAWSTVLNVTADPTGDADGDGIPNAVEFALGTTPGHAWQTDSGNTVQLNIHKPR